MKVQPIVEDLTDHEFERACYRCSNPATYAAWCRHNARCSEGHALCCDACEKDNAAFWRETVDEQDSCCCGLCGWTPSGELSDNYRVIRL